MLLSRTSSVGNIDRARGDDGGCRRPYNKIMRRAAVRLVKRLLAWGGAKRQRALVSNDAGWLFRGRR